jgi:hypothetical protein
MIKARKARNEGFRQFWRIQAEKFEKRIQEVHEPKERT